MSRVASTRREGGLESEELLRALDEALAGQPARLVTALMRHSGMPGPDPNLLLAAAFGDTLATRDRAAALGLLAGFAADDAAPDQPRVFLPMVAAYGCIGLLRDGRRRPSDERECWARLAELASDERAPVRLATTHALASLAARDREGGDRLVAAMEGWLGEGPAALDDRELRWGALATLLDAFTERRALAGVTERARLLELTSLVIEDIATSPRASERLDARRRLLAALSVAPASFVREIRGAADGVGWFEAECAKAHHPDLRRAFEGALLRLRKRSAKERGEHLERLDQAFASSKKPPRDPTRERQGTRRRGR